MKLKKMAILGCGSMAQALLGGEWKDEDRSSLGIEFYTFTPSQIKAQVLAQAIGGTFCSSLNALPPCDFYLVACKPQQFSSLAQDLRPLLSNPKTTILSIMAAIPVKRIQEELGLTQVMRVMPNTPSSVGAGVSLVYQVPLILEEDRKILHQFLQRQSQVLILEREEDMDVLTTVSGSGPAYVFEIGKILIDYLVQKNFSRDFATQLVKETLYGSALYLRESKEDPQVLRDQVTSKGGMTEKALQCFREKNLEKVFEEALESALQRAKEMA